MCRIFTVAVLALGLIALPVSPVAAQGNQAEVEEILTATSEVRGLEASPDVKVSYLTTAELEEKMLQEFEEDTPEEEIRDAQDIMVMLGFIPEGLDLKQLYIDLYTEQIAGFYDPEDGSLYLISEDRSMDFMNRYILAHELTHYLQDENFDLSRPPFDDPDDAEVETDDDASFAATCLVEGDAMLTAEKWMMEAISSGDFSDFDFGMEDYSTQVFDSSPEYIRDSLMFPYEEGQAFVEYVYEKGGYEAVDKAYSEPPTTTEQIYHPEKYVAGEDPVEVELPDLSGDLGDGWELAYDNVLGEFDVFELFKPYFSSRTAEQAAEGWGGNRYHFYRGGDGELLLVQGYAWDSEKDADEFAAAFVDYLKERFEDGLKEEASRGAWRAWSADAYKLAMKKDGKNTYIVQATDGEPLGTAVAALGEEGDAIEEGALEVEKAEKEEGEETDLSWAIIGAVIGLLVLGLALVVTMLVLYRRTPKPPAGPGGMAGPGGPYGYLGGGPGYGGPSGTGVTRTGAAGPGAAGTGGPDGPEVAGWPGGPIPPPPPAPPQSQ